MACIYTKSPGSPLFRTSLLPDAHTRRRCPPPLPCEASRHQTPGLAVLTWGGGVSKESINPCPGTRHPDLTMLCVPFKLHAHARRVRSRHFLWGVFASKVTGLFLNEPRPFLLTFLYIVRKGNSRQCMLKLLFTWVTSLKNPREGKRVSPLNCVLHKVFN